MSASSADSLADLLRQMSEQAPTESDRDAELAAAEAQAGAEAQADADDAAEAGSELLADVTPAGDAGAAADAEAGREPEAAAKIEVDAEAEFVADASGSVSAEVSESSTGAEALTGEGEDAADLGALASVSAEVETTVALPSLKPTAPDGAAAAIPRPAKAKAKATAARRSTGGLKALAVPILVTLGLLMLLPAVWGTLMLIGVEVPASDRDGATLMAAFMLVCWPIALAMFGIAGVLFRQVSRQKQRLNRGL
jgi:hypothetical protein